MIPARPLKTRLLQCCKSKEKWKGQLGVGMEELKHRSAASALGSAAVSSALRIAKARPAEGELERQR
jgi:hypothetical protein